jgi:hypothetical protein
VGANPISGAIILVFDRTVEARMRMVIEVRFDSDFVDSNPIRLCTIERTGSIDDAIGLALAEGRTLLAVCRSTWFGAQSAVMSASLARCAECKRLTVKGQHQRRLRTVFGCV